MHPLLDRLLFTLPPLSRATLKRGGLYALFGLILYGLFLGLLCGQEQLLVFLEQRLRQLPAVRVEMSRPELSFLSLQIDSARVGPRNAASGLVLRHIHVRPTVFPPGLLLNANIGTGTLRVTAAPASLWEPQHITVHADMTAVPFEEVLSATGFSSPLARIRGGALDGVLEAALPLSGRIPSDGKASLNVRGATLEHTLPMLVPPRLEGLTGGLELELKQNRLDLRRAEIRNSVLACTLLGQADISPTDPLGSRMDMTSTLRLPLEQIRQELMPQRTLNALRKDGEVRLRIRETFRRPSLDVQP